MLEIDRYLVWPREGNRVSCFDCEGGSYRVESVEVGDNGVVITHVSCVNCPRTRSVSNQPVAMTLGRYDVAIQLTIRGPLSC